MQNEFKKLENALHKLEKPGLNQIQRNQIKTSLFANINGVSKENVPFGLKKLISKVSKVGSSVIIPGWSKFMLRERIMEKVEESVSVYGLQKGIKWQGVIAGITAAFFVFGSVLFFPSQQNVVYAKKAYFKSVKGEVFVVRANKIIPAKEKMELKQGDTVYTSASSKATINYAEKSSTRVSDSTTIKIDKIELNGNSNVNINVEEGRVWTKITDPAGDSGITISNGDVSAKVETKGAFDMEVDNDEVEIQVFDNLVELETAGNVGKTVVVGYKAEINDKKDVKIEKMAMKDKRGLSSEWVAENLDEDVKFENEAFEKQKNKIKDHQKGEVMMATTLIEPVQSENNVLDEYKSRVDLIYSELTVAMNTLIDSDQKKGVEELNEFKESYLSFYDELEVLKNKQDPYFVRINEYVEEKFAEKVAVLALATPDDALYRAKEAMQELELMRASGYAEEVLISVNQAEQTLLEMQSMVKRENFALASSLLKRYANKTEQLVLNSEITADDLFVESLDKLVAAQVKHLKLLTAIEESIENRDQFELKERVLSVRTELVRRFLGSVEQYPHMVSKDLLEEVRSFNEVYTLEKNNGDAVETTVTKILDEEYQVVFIDPEDKGLQSEAEIMDELDASPEVKLEIKFSTIINDIPGDL
ncbi:hypothetical protein GF340_00700 [Candidatus Peregrinibacteria bacterium]|nr:hypothetical protein [Candidatus Peregrinibacteria bacterium]